MKPGHKLPISGTSSLRNFPTSGNSARGFFQSLELLIGIALFSVAVIAPVAVRAGDDAFAKAEASYKAGKFAESAALYRSLLDEGRVAPELFFNLGNSCFKQGELGAAVLNYRRAWMLSPRDPDIRANLRFALQKANATGPDLSIPARALTKLTQGEWSAAAVTAYWLCTAVLIVHVVVRGKVRGLTRAAAVLALVGALAITGILQWKALRSRPELVMTKTEQALFAPFAGGTPHFSLQEGSIVREIERSGNDWVRIEAGANSGWVQTKSCERVYPWKS